MVTLCTYIMCVTPLLSLSCAQHVVYCMYKNVSIASEIGESYSVESWLSAFVILINSKHHNTVVD